MQKLVGNLFKFWERAVAITVDFDQMFFMSR